MIERWLKTIFPEPVNPAYVARMIREWTPPPLTNERAYQMALYEHLLKVLPPTSTIKMNYPHAGMMVDVYVRLKSFVGHWEVFVELKYDLTTTECDRLIGQLHRLGLKRYICIVLVGEVDSSLIVRLREEFEGQLWGGVVGSFPSMFILDKGEGPKSNTGN